MFETICLYSQMKAPGLTASVGGKNKTLYMQTVKSIEERTRENLKKTLAGSVVGLQIGGLWWQQILYFRHFQNLVYFHVYTIGWKYTNRRINSCFQNISNYFCPFTDCGWQCFIGTLNKIRIVLFSKTCFYPLPTKHCCIKSWVLQMGLSD